MKTVRESNFGRRARHSPSLRPAAAFTLLEVMIAGGILFMCLFAILALVSNSLQNARLLQNLKNDPTASIEASVSYEFSNTNGALGSISGEFMGRPYQAESNPLTNGLYVVDLILPARRGLPEVQARLWIYNGKQTQPGMGRRPGR
jgi:hypothetical protein